MNLKITAALGGLMALSGVGLWIAQQGGADQSLIMCGQNVREVEHVTEPPQGCRIVVKDWAREGINDLDALRVVCSPCLITDQYWGPCPRCLDDAGGCAKACEPTKVNP